MDTLVETTLELDEESLGSERDGDTSRAAIFGDRDIRLMLRENRIALRAAPATRIESRTVVIYDVPLTCVVHAHPACRFQWSRLVVDLTPTHDARIRDMAPQEVIDERPVELTTTVGANLKFDIAKTIGVEISPQYSERRTVYFPQILSSGAGFTRGYWDFLVERRSA
jgi:hypothetical protein